MKPMATKMRMIIYTVGIRTPLALFVVLTTFFSSASAYMSHDDLACKIDTLEPIIDSVQFYLYYDANSDGKIALYDGVIVIGWGLSNPDFQVNSMVADMSHFGKGWVNLNDVLYNNRVFRKTICLDVPVAIDIADSNLNVITVWAFDTAGNYDTLRKGIADTVDLEPPSLALVYEYYQDFDTSFACIGIGDKVLIRATVGGDDIVSVTAMMDSAGIDENMQHAMPLPFRGSDVYDTIWTVTEPPIKYGKDKDNSTPPSHDADYVVKVTACDDVGNCVTETSDPLNRTLDTRVPRPIGFACPDSVPCALHARSLAGGIIELYWDQDCDENDAWYFYVWANDGSGWDSIGATHVAEQTDPDFYFWHSEPLAEGYWTFKIKTEDNCGNVGDFSCVVGAWAGAERGAVLIHGFNGSNDSWGGPEAPNLKSLLEADGRMVKYFSYPSSGPSDWNVPISTLASDLDASLTAWNDQLHIDEFGVDIIAHSMGGLIARYYVAHPDEFSLASNVKKLVTLGTPNYGAAVALWGDLVPGTIQATQCKFGSQFLWDLHEVWDESSFETDVLCIAGAKDGYSDPHDGVVLLPSASLENLGYPVCYIPNSHGGVGGMAYIEDVNHPSYIAIKSFLSGEAPQSNEENINHLTEGMLIAGLFDPGGNPISVGTFPLTGLPRVWWDPNPTLYWSWPWWPWLSSFGYGVNPSSGKYYATGADAGSYEIDIYSSGEYSSVINYPVIIEPRQTEVLSLTVYPADESATKTFASGDTPPTTFGNTDVTMDFSSGPGGDVSVYKFDDDPPPTDCTTLPHYWDIVSDMPDDSFSVTVAFNYLESEVLSSGLTEEELIIAYYDSLWHPMSTMVDTIADEVSVTTTHFTLFSIGNFPGTGIEEEPEIVTLPSSFDLLQNHPNPFNPSTTIKYQLKGESPSTKSPMFTTLKIYNIRGQLVRTLVNEENLPGNYSVIWDGKDQYGKEVASGIYFYRLQAGNYEETKRMVLLK